MNGIHRAIKKLRENKGLSQQQLADQLSISLKTYQNFENGITKLDLDRLKEVATKLEISVEELINIGDEGVYINEIKNNDVGYNNNQVNITHHRSELEKELYEKIIAEKDARIDYLEKDLTFLRSQLADLIKKMVG